MCFLPLCEGMRGRFRSEGEEIARSFVAFETYVMAPTSRDVIAVWSGCAPHDLAGVGGYLALPAPRARWHFDSLREEKEEERAWRGWIVGDVCMSCCLRLILLKLKLASLPSDASVHKYRLL